jgi:hypothetical protein
VETVLTSGCGASGWAFLGSLDHDGEEIVEAIRCRKCGGMGRIKSN